MGKDIAFELARRGIPTILVGTNERMRAVCDEIVTTWHVRSECYITDLTKRENVLKKIGIKRELGRLFLNIMYASNNKIKKQLIERAKKIAEKE